MLNGKLKQFLGLPAWLKCKSIKERIEEAVDEALEADKQRRQQEEDDKPWWRKKSFHTQNPDTGEYVNPLTLSPPKFNFFDDQGNDIPLDDARALGMDMAAITKEVFTMDYDQANQKMTPTLGVMPDILSSYYAAQGFIGWQNCAIIQQHWLVAKACYIKGRDAVRNGFKITCDGDDTLTTEDVKQIEEWNKKFDLTDNLIEADNFKNVFGIRHVLFLIETDDSEYYEKPFNPDGIKPGSYKGMSQIDPYWMAPLLSSANVADPSNKNFYVPEYWSIAGKRYHHSHFVILLGPEVPDVLKPSYQYGGLSLTQRIMERVYAAEQTANEVPILVKSKRLNVRQMDLQEAVTNQTKFEKAMAKMAQLRDNFGIYVMGKEEEFKQFETSLTDLDKSMGAQYDLVAAEADVPTAKLLEKSNRGGLNSNGEYETESYHETLESIQEHDMTPIVDRHHLCLSRSLIIPELNKSKDLKFTHEWNPCAVEDPEKRSKINLNDSQTAKNYTEIGAVDATMVYDRVTKDPDSGYEAIEGDRLPDIEPPEPKPEPKAK